MASWRNFEVGAALALCSKGCCGNRYIYSNEIVVQDGKQDCDGEIRFVFSMTEMSCFNYAYVTWYGEG
jgi:hypothetical protein